MVIGGASQSSRFLTVCIKPCETCQFWSIVWCMGARGFEVALPAIVKLARPSGYVVSEVTPT